MRYAILDARGVFYTVHKEVETIPIKAPKDMPGPGGSLIKKGDVIGDEHIFAPIFDSLKEMDASKFETEADALAQIAAWGDAGKGCTTVQVR
jgi:hypothetical protein